MKRVLCLAFTVLLSSSPALARTWLVTPDGLGDAPTIQAGIDSAISGDVVKLANGSFLGPGNQDISFNGKTIIVRSASDNPDSCIIDIQASSSSPHRGFLFDSGEGHSSILSAITITGGYAHHSVLPGKSGAGVLCRSGSSPTIRNCKFVNNRASNPGYGEGGAIGCWEGAHPILEDCLFQENHAANAGGAIFLDASSPTIESCEFIGNWASIGESLGGAIFARWGSNPNILDCSFIGNYVANSGERSGGAMFLYSGSSPAITGCEFSDNTSAGAGGAITCKESCDPIITDCDFNDNVASGSGGAISCALDSRAELRGCRFVGNRTEIYDGGAVCLNGSVSTIDDCVFLNNVSGRLAGGVMIWSGFSPTIRRCTFVGNSAVDQGGALVVWTDSYPTIEQTLIAFHEQNAALYCVNTGLPSFTCSNIYGNAGGDWTGNVSDQLGINGNINLDPLFCDYSIGDLTVQSGSPCLSGGYSGGGACGMIGALGQGCFSSIPCISSITDVGNDEGRQVRITWQRAANDELGSDPLVEEYGIYRRIDDYKMSGWDFLVSVPARGDDVYETVVPTLVDSTDAGGSYWSVFLVSAVTTTPQIFYDSVPDSGYSVDNLIPAVPSQLQVVYNSEYNTLSWQESQESDVAWYNVYRSVEGEDRSNRMALVAQVAGTSWVDNLDGAVGSAWEFIYQITAVDDSGNESEPTQWGQAEVSGVGDQSIQKAAVLHRCVPNPFNPQTTISFDLPSEMAVSLRVYDISGCLVDVLLDDRLASAGRNEVVWRGRDLTGRLIPSGTYLYRLEAGGYMETKRMTLLK